MADYSKVPDDNSQDNSALVDELRENQRLNEEYQNKLDSKRLDELKARDYEEQEAYYRDQARNRDRDDSIIKDRVEKQQDKQDLYNKYALNNPASLDNADGKIPDAKDQVPDAGKQVNNALKQTDNGVIESQNQQAPSAKPTRKKRKPRIADVAKAVGAGIVGKKVVDSVRSKKEDKSESKEHKQQISDALSEQLNVIKKKASDSSTSAKYYGSYANDLKEAIPQGVDACKSVMNAYGVKFTDKTFNNDDGRLNVRLTNHVEDMYRNSYVNKMKSDNYASLANDLENTINTNDPRQLNNLTKVVSSKFKDFNDNKKQNDDMVKMCSKYLNDKDALQGLSFGDVKKITGYDVSDKSDVSGAFHKGIKDYSAKSSMYGDLAADYNQTVTVLADHLNTVLDGKVDTDKDLKTKKGDVKFTIPEVVINNDTREKMPLKDTGLNMSSMKRAGHKVDPKAEQALESDTKVLLDDEATQKASENAVGVEDAIDSQEKGDLMSQIKSQNKSLHAENEDLKSKLEAMQERISELESNQNTSKPKRKRKFFDKFKKNREQFNDISTKDLLLESSLRIGRGFVKIGATGLATAGVATMYAAHKTVDIAKRMGGNTATNFQSQLLKGMGMKPNNGLER